MLLGPGEKCKKCNNPMHRFTHKPEWKPSENQYYFYSYWDKCFRCNILQHYEKAKVLCNELNTIS